jgi:hypothetical protein
VAGYGHRAGKYLRDGQQNFGQDGGRIVDRSIGEEDGRQDCIRHRRPIYSRSYLTP